MQLFHAILEPVGRVKFLTAFLLVILLSSSINAGITQKSHRRTGDKQTPAELIALADTAAAEGDSFSDEWKAESFRAAIKKYSEALRYRRLANETRGAVESLKRLGDVYSLLSDYEIAIDYYNKALQLARGLPERQPEVDILNQISNTYLETANITKALPYSRQAREISDRIGYRRGVAESLNNAGVINYASGDVLRAQEDFNQALDIWQEVKYDEGLASTLLNLGYLHGDLGNTDSALDFYRRALDVSQAANYRLRQALTFTATGGAYALQGEKQKALNLHNQALTLFRTIGNRSGEAATLNGIGYLYDDLGNKAEALKFYAMALRLYQAVGNQNYAAITLGYIGRVYFALGNKEKALEFYRQKLVTNRAVRDRRMESYTLKDIGNVLSSTAEKETALDYYKQALSLSREFMDRRGEAYILSSIGSLYEQLNSRPKALEFYKQALSLMQVVADRRGEVITLFNIARAERDSGRLADARARIERSLGLIEYLRTKVASPSLRISYLETVYQHYEFYIDLLMRMDRQEPGAGYGVLALEVNERARARVLLENLIESGTNIRQGVAPELLAEETQVRQQLNQKAEQYMRLLSGRFAPERASAIKKEVEALLARYEEVETKVRDKSPRYAALTQPRQLKLSDIQKELDQDTVLLEYSLGAERSYVWVVTSTSVNGFDLPSRSKIEAAAKKLYGQLATSNTHDKSVPMSETLARPSSPEANYLEAAAELSQTLLGPVAPLLWRKRLAIVADGILQYIPFTALPEPSQTTLGPVPSDPLVVGHEVVMLPSLSTLAVMRNEVRGRTKASKAVAVIADPVFERDDPRVTATGREGSTMSQTNPARRNKVRLRRGQLSGATIEDGDEPITFQRLPFTLQEAEEILSIVPQAEAKRAVGFDASLRTALDPELRQYRIIHFATHALLDNSHPELSGVVLSLVDRTGRPQDGFLRLNEIYNLDLPAELVVLSACQTALGKEARGEGLIGLTRGFMYAGVPRIVASLWRIDDRAAAELMRYFYEEMFWHRLPPAAALRAAQIKMWKTAEWKFPHYWAAFVLEGEWN
jgi:CHAT domain-containing protein/predicted negative regulator of RcsB-dependent stress response